ncbi:unnamed protein product [Orchesella dallaii]|uniref:Arrestin-like N-terminal domain-containing protein n=1 Tax=Orchesella dallaii TaxID=48710 RepID=A0ABP1QC73_9HEXA
MGSLKAWLQGATIRNTKPGKIQHFGGNFNSYIVLEEAIMVPYGVIRGKFLLESNFHPKITGLRVQLEAECILRLTTMGKNGRLVHRKKVCVLENTEIDDKGDLLSPIRHDLLKPTDADHGKHFFNTPNYLLNNFLHTIFLSHSVYVIASLSRNGTTTGYSTFFLPIPGVTLPAPFKNPYGSLVYKVVGYLRSYYCRYVPVAEETVQFTGYHNLSQNRSAQRPINIERPFNGPDGLYTTAILSAETSGYLPGEELQFLLILECNRCVPIVMKVFLSQKISYNVDGVIKNLFTTIDFKQKEDAIEISKEIIWQDLLTLPKHLDPSYSCHPAYTVKYAIRVRRKTKKLFISIINLLYTI